MSQSVRQSNLFAAEDWQAIYRSFQDVDFKAYDFDTIRDALIDYVRTYYPEEFNDYIESSEFVAMIELLSYLGTSLSFRVDLNSRENFLDTAERRESIIRLARMLSYTPRRNLPATGLFKLTAVETNETITDSVGRELNNVTVFWNDPNNPDAFEQFITILNAAFVSTNPFGRPFKTGLVGSVPTDLYQFESTNDIDVAYNINVRIRGDNFPIDIVNVDFSDGEFFFERAPDPANPFHIIYRNDGEGLESANTGFFFLFKQGQLQNVDERFDFPVPNRTYDIDIQNINENDVYLQQIDQSGNVLAQWTKVPSLIGNNAIFNSISAGVRNIYSVIPRQNDQITLRFADGSFGNTPTGIFRTWVRTSANRNITIRSEDVQNAEITIPYFGSDGQEYNLRMLFSLEQTVANATRAETNTQIKERAPQVYYTQNRMVNGEDYNVFPLTRGNQIIKLKAVNRTHAGHSRFIDINDPTGTFQNVIVFGEDGALYADNEPARIQTRSSTSEEDIAETKLNEFIKNQFLQNFFYSDYYNQYLATLSVSELELVDLFWYTQPGTVLGATGFFVSDSTDPNTFQTTFPPGNQQFLQPGAKVRFENPSDPTETIWVTVKSNVADGAPTDPTSVTDTGPIALSTEVENGWQAVQVIPRLRTNFTPAELEEIIEELELNTVFGLGYDIEANNGDGAWYVITSPDENAAFNVDPSSPDSWLIYADFDAAGGDNWEFISRGKRFIFESAEAVKFFFDEDLKIVDVLKGRALRDIIEILPTNTMTPAINSGPLGERVKFNIQTRFMYEDGYRDPRKVIVKSVDEDQDGVPDDPLAINSIVLDGEDLFFERFTDFDGYEYFRLWRTLQVENATPSVTDVVFDSGVGAWFFDGELAAEVGLIITDDEIDLVNAINGSVSPDSTDTARTQSFAGTIVYNGTDFFELTPTALGTSLEAVPSTNHIRRTGRSFTLNTADPFNPFYFKWKHYAPRDNRIDPSISNVIDTYVLTTAYFRDVIQWKETNSEIETFPRPLTTEELRVQFAELNQFKMLSDQIIFKPTQFKLMFGIGAEPELRARFKVVKLPTTTITDNEIRSRVIQAVEDYFDLANWDFGESFFYTELSAFIHQQLANVISTVVIVPQKADSAFGNLFQVKSEPNELFLNTATAADVDIVRNLTETNMRIR